MFHKVEGFYPWGMFLCWVPGGDLALVETSLLFFILMMLFSCQVVRIYIRKAVRFLSKQGHLTFISRPGNQAHNCKMVYCSRLIVITTPSCK